MSVTSKIEPILNLTKARELALLDAEHCMGRAPETVAQRQKMIAGMERIIGQSLFDLQKDDPIALSSWKDRVSNPGDTAESAQDSVSQRALAYIATAEPLRSPPASPSAYDNLKRVFDLYGDLDQAGSVVSWIQDTRLIPNVTNENIYDAKAGTSQFSVRLLAQNTVEEWLQAAAKDDLNPDDRRNLELMKNMWVEAVGLGEERIEAFERVRSASNDVWEVEKKKAEAGHPEEADYDAILPSFKIMLDELRLRGELLGKALGVPAYQALMYSSNPGLSRETVENVFRDLDQELPELARVIIEKQKHEPQPIPLPEIDEADQMRVIRRLMHALGLDAENARADQAGHPGSYLNWDDQRVTVRRGKRDLLSRLIGLIHETGHEIYAKNLPLEWKDQPIGNAQSMWVHETQSLFWEREVAFTLPFMRFLSKLIRDELGDKYDMSHPAWNAENLLQHTRKVLPDNPIRTEADDVTYPLHVMIRQEIGPKLFDGTIAPENFPEAWNKAYAEKLGVKVKNIIEGCMQDMQIPWGNFPGFAGYSFGRFGARMLGKAIRIDMNGQAGKPDFDVLVENGHFSTIAKWLTEKIHRHGSRYEGVELLERATGMKFSIQPYLDAIRERYGLDKAVFRPGQGNSSHPQTVPEPA